ncbi:plastocyanin/azurin family copper-binding protein [Streptomyces sp. NPDC017964]|uniref:cupredoxin domain-containing protein n=1 Tax=Streptomyces sp. NPDC017964 TaxID=3365022 RepID=UPI00379F5030
MPRLTTLARVALATLLLSGAFTVLDAPSAHANGHQIVMSGYAFGPRTLTITAGDTVTWVNQDSAPHDVKTTSGPEPVHSPMLDKAGTWSHTFTVAGSYGYVCTVHPGMTAQLVVKAAAPRTPTPQAPPAHRHDNPAPSTASPAREPAPATSSAHPHPHRTKSTAAAVPAPSSAAPSTPADRGAPVQPAAAADTAAGSARPLDPLLILAGVVAGVAVLCLLLVGSRSATGAAAGQGGAAKG